MPVIVHPPLREAVEHYERLVAAVENYQAFLQARLERYESEGRDPATYRRPVTNKMSRVTQLIDHLNGETYDLLRWLIDGTATLEGVEQGRWV